MNRAPHRDAVSLREACSVWGRIGLLSFGGPAAQIALMHRFLVDERGWLEEKEFLGALSFCMLLPGPEAMQLATYAGWRLHGVRGGLLAGLLFVLPGACLILMLAWLYATLGNAPLVDALFHGIKAAVLVIVIQALYRVAQRALLTRPHRLIAIAAFAALFLFTIPYPLVIALAAFAGALMPRVNGDDRPGTVDGEHAGSIDAWSTLRTIGLWLGAWWLPIGALWLLGAERILIELALFFSTLAVVTFGGAYAVLAYLAQDAVVQHGWLSATAMIDGLALAETTPGPLILVTEFVGFLAAHGVGGLGLGLAGALVTLWVTFVPCFLWIFASAPYLEWLTARPRLREALAGISAAVVGVILNLSLWFGLHALFASVEPTRLGPLNVWIPDWHTLDVGLLGLTMLCGILVFRFALNVVWLLVVAATLGYGLTLT